MPRLFDLENALKTAKDIHRGFYDYSRVRYVSAREKVEIVCPDHGPFWQRIGHHTGGHGCRKCSGLRLSRRRLPAFCWFRSSALAVHGDRYGYPEQRYQGRHGQVEIVCPDHGPFSQRAAHHLAGRGCAACARGELFKSRAGSAHTFKEKADAVHGSRYGYSGVEYRRTHDKGSIVCQKHGVFQQEPANHLAGKGCPGCAVFGFKRKEPACLYFLYAETANALKVGVTNNFGQRLRQLARATPFAFYVLATKYGPGDEMWAEERRTLRGTQTAGLSGFDGATEWRTPSPSLFETVRLYSGKEGG